MIIFRKISPSFQRWPLFAASSFAFGILALIFGAALSASPVLAQQPQTEASQNQVPLDKPNMGSTALLSWATAAASDTMTIGSTDYQNQLKRSARYFTKAGWETFAAFMQRLHLIEEMKTNSEQGRQIETLTAQQGTTPVVTEEGVEHGNFHWQVTMPLILTKMATRKDGSSIKMSTRLLLSLRIERVAAPQNPAGIAISQWRQAPLFH